MQIKSRRLHLTAITLAVALSGCSGTATVSGGGPAADRVAVAVLPVAAQVVEAKAVDFAVTVTGTALTSVTWAVVEPGGGSVDAAGHYVAPAAAGVFHVRVTSVAEPRAIATAEVTVSAPPAGVTITATPAAAVDACQPVTLAASVTGSSNQAVTWTVAEGAVGGSISAAGVYTAPVTAGVYHAVARSDADPTKSATATVTVSERVVGVEVSPANATVPASGTTQLTATVTTTCGAFATVALLGSNGLIVAQ